MDTANSRTMDNGYHPGVLMDFPDLSDYQLLVLGNYDLKSIKPGSHCRDWLQRTIKPQMKDRASEEE